LGIPNGLSNAVLVILMPYVLRRQGVAVDPHRRNRCRRQHSRSGISSIAGGPISVCAAATWILLSAAGAGLFAALAVLSRRVMGNLTALLLASGTVGSLISSANGALLSFLDPHVRGRASGWYQAGNLGGGTIGGGLAIWLADRVNLPGLALGVIVLIVSRPPPRSYIASQPLIAAP